jgi:hypothetical protein
VGDGRLAQSGAHRNGIFPLPVAMRRSSRLRFPVPMPRLQRRAGRGP